jgi:hypothetical protein
MYSKVVMPVPDPLHQQAAQVFADELAAAHVPSVRAIRAASYTWDVNRRRPCWSVELFGARTSAYVRRHQSAVQSSALRAAFGMQFLAMPSGTVFLGPAPHVRQENPAGGAPLAVRAVCRELPYRNAEDGCKRSKAPILQTKPRSTAA